MSSEKNALVATHQLLGKTQKKSNFIFIFGQMIEDQVLFHLPKFGKNIFSLRGFPHPLKGHDKAVRQGPRFGTLKSVSTHGLISTADLFFGLYTYHL